jgi:hypothetical protein
LHNDAGGKGRRLASVAAKKRHKASSPFTGGEDDARLTRGALLPTRQVFRWMVTENAAGELVWRTSFEDVLVTGPR